jgi:hypothetical protein
MNLFRVKPFPAAIGRLTLLLVLFLFIRARGAEESDPQRWLLVIDTSATMKKCLPGTETAVKQFFATSADGQLQPGDSVAVWLVNQQINGQFPTFTMGASNVTVLTSNLPLFIQRQRHASPSHLGILQTPLNRVVAGSRRLTVILFTDGQSEIAGTPYDDGVNQTFHDVQADRRKNQQPVVVVMRSQMGKFAGCTLAFPPSDLNYPPFPELPKPPPVATNLTIKAPTPPPPAEESLVIVGKQIVTNLNTNTAPQIAAAAPVVSNNPPAVAAGVATNPPPAAPLVASNNPPPVALTTNFPAQSAVKPPVKAEASPIVASASSPTPSAVVVPPVAPAPVRSNSAAPVAAANQATPKFTPPATVTNAVAAVTVPPAGHAPYVIYAGFGIAAITIVGLAFSRLTRRPQASLISRSMQDDTRRK